MTFLLAEDDHAATACVLRLAKIHGEHGRLKDAEKALSLLEELLDKDNHMAKLYRDLIMQRFLEARHSTSDRINRLMQLSTTLLELGDYDVALQALEYAAELVGLLPNLSQAAAFGTQIHGSLKAVCDRSGDALSRTLVEFRHCDLLNAFTGSLAEARERRKKLLSAPVCTKLPYLQRFHKRQWAEYLMLHQREDALYHAERYLEYCRKCKSEEEKSLAETILLQTILQPRRASEEKRVDILEDARTRLERGIQTDEGHGWYHAQVEKQLLLVEVLEELGRLQGDDLGEVVTVATEVLNQAEAACNKIDWKADNAYSKYEVAFLRGSASLLLEARPPEFVEKSNTSLLAVDFSEGGQATFNRTRYLQPLVFAIQNECLPTFEHLFKQLCELTNTFTPEENAIKRAELLTVKAMVCYLLMEFVGPTIHQFRSVAGFESLTAGAEVVLELFGEAFDLKDQIESEANDGIDSADKMHALAASQAYFTSELEQLYFDIALELTVSLQDNGQTWQWIQRRKARGISKTLRNLLPAEQLKHASDYLSLRGALTFEHLQWVQTASAAKLVFVDWVSFGTCPSKLLFFSFAMDKDKDGPFAVRKMVEIETPLEDLKEAVGRINEARMNDSDADRYLRPLIPVVRPLEESSDAGDILLLSPTAPLHNVPLHAVPISSKILIERNPVVYVPSHTALVSCLQRLAAPEPQAEAPTTWTAAVFGAYEDASSDSMTEAERYQIYRSLRDLGCELGATVVLGAGLTTGSFKQHSASADLIHFHGHGISDTHAPTRQSLVLGPPMQHLTISDIASLNISAAHVTLIACSGGVQDFSLSGDDPLGLLASFLLGGATSVLGALWPIQSSTGRLFTRVFYDYFLHHVDRAELGPIVNLARALQHTALEIRKKDDTKRPYHWAPFVLYGAWFCRRKPGSW
jgi:CHAT domain-containing protein/tetratricopeptide (TPR) repeat protein